jgi:hypothetical protein
VGRLAERDDGIETVAELRREQPVDRFHIVAFALGRAEADGGLGHVGCTRIGGHDQDHVAEIDLLAVVVGQLAVIHHLQQDVEQVRMRLLDLVEQQHAVGMLIDAIGQQPALVETDIAGRRADQRLTVCRSMYSDMSKRSSSTPSEDRQLLGDFGLADAGWAGEQVGADRLVGLAQAGARQLDRRRQRIDGLSWP